jgi:hypothetical protein
MPTAVGERDVPDPNLPPAYAAYPDQAQQPVAQMVIAHCPPGSTSSSGRVHTGKVDAACLHDEGQQSHGVPMMGQWG